MPRVDIERDNGRVVAVYLDQFLIRGVRAISFHESVGDPPTLNLELVVSDVVVRDTGANTFSPTEALKVGGLDMRVSEGALLLGLSRDTTR